MSVMTQGYSITQVLSLTHVYLSLSLSHAHTRTLLVLTEQKIHPTLI